MGIDHYIIRGGHYTIRGGESVCHAISMQKIASRIDGLLLGRSYRTYLSCLIFDNCLSNNRLTISIVLSLPSFSFRPVVREW